MNTLNIVNESEIAEIDRREIDEHIDRVISRHRNNRYEINKLVFESVSALTVSENYSNELVSQGVLKRFWGGVTGKNRKLQSKIDNSIRAAQYASQQTLQKLAEQNMMSFELITAVNNKLNASVIEIEKEINNIYGTLVTFFKKTKSDIIQLENRVERLERNVNLLNWQNSIEYQMWDGVEYSELDDVSKIVCLTRDFYDITQGKWTVSDLLLLKTAMADIGISPKIAINYKMFIKAVSENEKLINKLFGEVELEGIDEYPEYVAVSAGIQKSLLYESEEKYIVDASVGIMRKYGCGVSFEDVKDEMLTSYEMIKAQIDLKKEISSYDFMLELLYNIEQIKDIKYVETLDDKIKEAEMLFSIFEIDRLLPLLDELILYGVVKAKYMMALIYEIGYCDLKRNPSKCEALLDECIEDNYLPAKVRRLISSFGEVDCEKCQKEIPLFFDRLEELAKDDMFAAEECARIYINPHFLGLERNQENYQKAINYFYQAPKVLGYYGIARRYEFGEGVEKKLELALEYYEKSANYGHNDAARKIGCANQHLWTSSCKHSKAGEWYEKAYKLGNHEAITNLAWCYSEDNNEYGVVRDDDKFFELSMEAYKLGDMPAWGICNIGWAYRYGHGVARNIDMAKKYYREAADMGQKAAIDALKELE